MKSPNSSTSTISLWRYIFKTPSNRWYVWASLFFIPVQLIVFKFFYPYAGFINGDSYVYLETAYHNLTVNTYPTGYSMFLRLFSIFTKSDTALVVFQYLFIQITALSLMFSIFYLYNPSKITRIFLLVVVLLNPVFLYLSNYISSDPLFLSLSLAWFTMLLWIMYQPSVKLILINSIVLFIAFTVRYNAMFYPIIGCVALILTRRRILMNVVGFGISIVLIFLFIQSTSSKYQAISGHRQFSPFTGWQLANNALYAYRYVGKSSLNKVPPRFKEIDGLVRNYFDTTRDISKYPKEGLLASTVYMWDPYSPLSIYMNNQFVNDTTSSPLKKWATVAPMMNAYGSFLIRSYPNEFVKYYLIPNALKYYAPPVEFLDTYSTGVDSVPEIAKVWFNYKNNKLTTRVKDFKVNILNFYPVLTGIVNVILVFSMMSFWILKGYTKFPELKKGLILVIALWAVNFSFSVFASPIALRFQLFPILVSLCFCFLLVEYLVKEASGESIQEPIPNSKCLEISEI